MRRLSVLTLAVALALAGRAAANPVDAFGFGSRAPALGGAVTADVEDASANYYNPAGIVRGEDLRLDVGYRAAQPIAKINGRNVGVDASRGLAIGIATPAHLGPVKIAFGAMVWLPDQRLTRVRTIPFDQPRFVLYDNLPQRLVFSAGLAVQIIPGLSIGGGLTFMSATTGGVALKGTLDIGDANASDLASRIDVDLTTVRYPQLGILWQATKWLSLGLTYRHSYLLTSELGLKINGNIGNPTIVEGAVVEAQTRISDLFQPWQLTLGAALRLKQDVMILFDLSYARWSEFPIPAGMFDLNLDLKQYQSMVNLPPPPIYPQSGFHDIVIPRLGVEVHAIDRYKWGLDVRGGYSYEPTPVPEQIGRSSFADADKHTFALGLGLLLKKLGPILPRPLGFDVHLAVTALPDRANHKMSPVDRTGDFVASGVVVNAGASMQVRF